MRFSSLVRFVEDKAIALHAAAKPVVAAHCAAVKQAQVAYKASLQPAPVRKPAAARKSTATKRR